MKKKKSGKGKTSGKRAVKDLAPRAEGQEIRGGSKMTVKFSPEYTRLQAKAGDNQPWKPFVLF